MCCVYLFIIFLDFIYSIFESDFIFTSFNINICIHGFLFHAISCYDWTGLMVFSPKIRHFGRFSGCSLSPERFDGEYKMIFSLHSSLMSFISSPCVVVYFNICSLSVWLYNNINNIKASILSAYLLVLEQQIKPLLLFNYLSFYFQSLYNLQ